MEIYSSEEASFNKVSKVGLVIGYIPSAPDQRHVGFLLKANEEANAKALDLSSGKINYRKPRDGMAWTDLGLDPFTKKALQAKCISISKRKESEVPYSFLYDGEYFNSDGAYNRNGENEGLTCSTFILAVFRSIGIEIISFEDWPSRLADQEWQEKMVPILVEKLKLPEDGLVKQLGSPRVRPEEATVAACDSVHPVTFSRIEELSKELLNQLFEKFPHPTYDHKTEPGSV